MFDLDKLHALGALAAQQARERAAADPMAANNIIGMSPLLKPWKDGIWKKGDVCVFDGMPHLCLMDHDSTGNPVWSPGNETALWALYHGRDAAHALPFRAEGHNPYMAGEWCTEDGKLYECTEDNTVWPPSALEANWKEGDV